MNRIAYSLFGLGYEKADSLTKELEMTGLFHREDTGNPASCDEVELEGESGWVVRDCDTDGEWIWEEGDSKIDLEDNR